MLTLHNKGHLPQILLLLLNVANDDLTKFRSQLSKLGLRLREVVGDGNCLFRALSDQIDGSCSNHELYRQSVADYMVLHREDFEPFVEDDVPFDEHIASMRTTRTFAGNDAIVAFSRIHAVHIIIHQLNSSCLHFHGSDRLDARQLHISYHNGNHYNSIRWLEDGNNETARPANVYIKDMTDDMTIQVSEYIRSIRESEPSTRKLASIDNAVKPSHDDRSCRVNRDRRWRGACYYNRNRLL